MAHPMKEKDFKEIRENRYTVISFKDGKRIHTYSGLPAHRALQETIERSSSDASIVCKMFLDADAPTHHSWNLADY